MSRGVSTSIVGPYTSVVALPLPSLGFWSNTK